MPLRRELSDVLYLALGFAIIPTDLGKLARSTNDALPELRKTNQEIGALAQEARDTIPELKKTNDQLQATLITWQKTGERAKLILDKNEEKIGESLDED